MKLGFDKSSYDGSVNWGLAKSRQIDWTSMRASFGKDEDKLFAGESSKALAADVIVVPYHYYIPKKIAAKVQADKFLACIGKHPTRAMLDLEDYQSTVAYPGIAEKELRVWLDAVEQTTGKKPFIYTSPTYINSYLLGSTWLCNYPLIVANYKVSAPYVPAIWTPLDLAGWQFSSNSDARYYGFEQAKGCALQIIYDQDLF